MIKVIPTKPGHLDFLKTIEPLDPNAPYDLYLDRAVRVHAAPVATLVSDDKPIAIVGLMPLPNGIAEAFAFVGVEARGRAIGIHRCVLRLLEQHGASYRRIQLTVRDGFAQGEKWATALGFKLEGVMRSYGPDGSDHFLFARVK